MCIVQCALKMYSNILLIVNSRTAPTLLRSPLPAQAIQTLPPLPFLPKNRRLRRNAHLRQDAPRRLRRVRLCRSRLVRLRRNCRRPTTIRSARRMPSSPTIIRPTPTETPVALQTLEHSTR